MAQFHSIDGGKMEIPTPLEDNIRTNALALYEVLRRHGSRTPEVAEAEANLEAPAAPAAWQELRDLKMIRIGTEPGEVGPVEPEAAALDLLEAQWAALQETIRRAAALEDYRRAAQRVLDAVEIELVSDPGRKTQVVENFNRLLTETADSMHAQSPPREVMEASLESDVALLAQGVRVRALYGRATLAKPGGRKFLEDMSRLGVDVRLAHHIPVHMIMGDGHSAILPAYPDRPAAALFVVRSGALLPFVKAIYEDYWLRSVALESIQAEQGEEQGLTELEKEIIRLLASGLTDEVVSRKLDVSTRKVQRTVKRLMEITGTTGTTSRFQAGAKAVQLGLI